MSPCQYRPIELLSFLVREMLERNSASFVDGERRRISSVGAFIILASRTENLFPA